MSSMRLLRPTVSDRSKLQMRAVLIAALLAAAATNPAFADALADANAAEARGDFAAALPIYRALAEKGNVGAQRRLGYLYEIGAGVDRDWLEAAEWYSKAAEAGDEGAAAALGFIGRNWVRVNSTGNQVIYGLVEKAAKMGNARAIQSRPDELPDRRFVVRQGLGKS
jgi:TPR repeat protein